MNKTINHILTSLMLILGVNVYSNSIDLNFRHITLNEGLSNSNVNCITQDSNGFVWIGTENGLNKFDGYTFTHYFSDANQKNSLYSNEIFDLLVDSEGILWIGTFQGLFKYNETYDNFDNIPIDSINLLNANIPVYSIIEDDKDIIWVGTAGNGLIKYNKQTNKYKPYFHSESNPFSISSNHIFKIFKDSKNVIWIGTTNNGLERYERESDRFYNYKPIKDVAYQQNINAILEIFEFKDNTFLLGTRGDGLFLFNTDTKIFSPYTFKVDNKDITRPSEVYSIYNDKQNHLWISTHGNGLYYFDDSYTSAIKIEHQNDNPASLINNNVRKIFEDRQGNLWIVSYQGGINFLPNMHNKFQAYNIYDNHSDYLSTTVTSISPDKDGNIWVGVDGAGLKYIDRSKNTIKHFYPGDNTYKYIPDKVVMSLLLNNNELWIGTYLGGLSVYDIKKQTFKNYKATGKPGSLGSNFITCFLKSSRGDMWIGTNGGGLNKYNALTDNFTLYTNTDSLSDTRLLNNYINALAEDNNGRIWIGTFWGLSIFDPLNGFFVDYLRQDTDEGELSNNTIYCIKITSRNEIWLGTRNGLNKFIPSKNAFKSFNLSDGLPGNVIYSIQESNNGDLWLSTNNGICNFNTRTFETHNYYQSDGLSSNEFFRNASYKDKNGEMFFGGINGLNSFMPHAINESYEVPKAIITQFRIFDQVIKPGVLLNNTSILDKPVYNTKVITLKHSFNSFAFEFAALDFILPEKNNYRCKMEGFDQDWRTMSNNLRYVTYTNLDPGTYTFKIKASSIDNVWDNNYTSIKIIIKPPFYRTWWAYIIYFILFVGLIIILWFISIKRVKLKNQIRIERIERNKSEEVNQSKLRFFTNVSHEFRTPITLIVGPLEKMLSDKLVAKKYKDSINMMLNNANRLLRLVNQLMDLRKIETGKMTLKTEKSNIIIFLRDIYSTFFELAQQKQIDFRFLSEYETIDCWFDPDKLDKIIFNLLSNAFKFTKEGGEIILLIEKNREVDNADWLIISVIDTGKGIAEEDQPKVFDRFYQTKDPSQRSNIGSGVGLSLTHSLVEQHYGKISFTSEENKGTRFHVQLPLWENAYSDEEKFSPTIPGVNKYLHIIPEQIIEEDIKPLNNKNSRFRILIVEDNFDLRRYLVQELSEYYDILEAADGKEGLNKALDEMPDLIISDVLMPEMDGLELSRRLKENFLTNHIPIIMLTARASMEQRIVGIESGADSYISKPFNPSHLKMRIKKLLELRQVLKAKYNQELESPEVLAPSTDDFYLKEIKELIVKNISDPDLSIEKICKEVGISRGHMYRKIKLITDKSPSEFVRLIRLNEASNLLLHGNKTISEICYMVGFNSPSYFSICFKEQFNISPTDFVRKNKPDKK